jgi:hypothetical protein
MLVAHVAALADCTIGKIWQFFQDDSVVDSGKNGSQANGSARYRQLAKGVPTTTHGELEAGLEARLRDRRSRALPDGPVCPHCGGVERISKMGGKSTRILRP